MSSENLAVVKEIYAAFGRGDVVVLIDVVATVKERGKRFREEDEVHIWHFDEAHRVTRFRHRVDTRQQLAAFRPAG